MLSSAGAGGMGGCSSTVSCFCPWFPACSLATLAGSPLVTTGASVGLGIAAWSGCGMTGWLAGTGGGGVPVGS